MKMSGMKTAVVIIFAVAALLPSVADAGKTYTKDELNRMVAAGTFPDQGPTRVVSDKPMSMDDCRLAVARIASATVENYPTVVVVDTAIAYLIKFWTNDGVILATCGDGKLLINRANYR